MTMEIKRYGSHALLVEFEQSLSPTVNDQVHALREALQPYQQDWLQYLIPSYASLLISFDPRKISSAQVQHLVETTEAPTRQLASRIRWEIPVCYAPSFGLDLMTLTETLKLSVGELIQCHTAPAYRVYACGFLPGFPYMGKTDARLTTARKATPRQRVAAGSVGLAGNQTGIYPVASPGGWQIIGRTPVRLLRTRNAFPFFIQAGHTVTFRAIARDEFEDISVSERAGTFSIDALKKDG